MKIRPLPYDPKADPRMDRSGVVVFMGPSGLTSSRVRGADSLVGILVDLPNRSHHPKERDRCEDDVETDLDRLDHGSQPDVLDDSVRGEVISCLETDPA